MDLTVPKSFKLSGSGFDEVEVYIYGCVGLHSVAAESSQHQHSTAANKAHVTISQLDPSTPSFEKYGQPQGGLNATRLMLKTKCHNFICIASIDKSDASYPNKAQIESVQSPA